MSKRLITLTVVDVRNKPWAEDYEIDSHLSYQEWAEETIQSFNDSLRPDEKARTLSSVEDKGVFIEHYDDEDEDEENINDDW